MIDSIVWQLNKDQFKLNPVNAFDGSKSQKIKGFSNETLFCNEYRNELKKRGIYFPSLEISKPKRIYGIEEKNLDIQVSLTKMLYGSNTFEIDENDIGKIYNKMISLLNDAGVETSINNLKQAIIRRADFSKIIILPVYLGKANEIILKLVGFNYKPSSIFDFMNYKKGLGASIRFGNSTQKYTIYDKIGEIVSKEKKHTKTEDTIIKAMSLREDNRRVLKFELSYNRKDSFEKAMRSRLKINKKRNYCLEEILKLELSQNILTKVFDSVFSSIAVGLVSLSEMEENKLFAYLENSNLSQLKQRELYYWVRMATKNGIGGTWSEIKRKYKGGSISKKKKDIALILQELGKIDGNIPNLIDFLREEHKKFEIIKPKRNSQLSTIVK